MRPPLLVPSLLAGDHARLADSAALVDRLGLPWIHIDIMDGHFVPNLTFGPETVAALRRSSAACSSTCTSCSTSRSATSSRSPGPGANLISIHIEPAYDHAGTLARIRQLGCQCGIVLNPDTPAAAVEPFLGQVDLVLVMTVQPGFGGQSFRRDTLPKIAQVAAWRRARQLAFRLEVDGGIDLGHRGECRAAGADTFVAGTSFFGAAGSRRVRGGVREAVTAGRFHRRAHALANARRRLSDLRRARAARRRRHSWLSTRSYWAAGVPARNRRALGAELPLRGPLHRGGEQVGLVRIVTDYATYAWLCDVYVLEAQRGRGLSKAMLRAVLSHPQLQSVRRFTLATRDAHGLYAQFGFKPVATPDAQMENRRPQPWQSPAPVPKSAPG